jgi:hypothetical protein
VFRSVRRRELLGMDVDLYPGTLLRGAEPSQRPQKTSEETGALTVNDEKLPDDQIRVALKLVKALNPSSAD